MNRRGFLGILAGAIVGAAVGIEPAKPMPSEYASGEIGRTGGFDVYDGGLQIGDRITIEGVQGMFVVTARHKAGRLRMSKPKRRPKTRPRPYR